jgi:hypothetical protein
MAAGWNAGLLKGRIRDADSGAIAPESANR